MRWLVVVAELLSMVVSTSLVRSEVALAVLRLTVVG
jgi:hypothetical protein